MNSTSTSGARVTAVRVAHYQAKESQKIEQHIKAQLEAGMELFSVQPMTEYVPVGPTEQPRPQAHILVVTIKRE